MFWEYFQLVGAGLIAFVMIAMAVASCFLVDDSLWDLGT